MNMMNKSVMHVMMLLGALSYGSVLFSMGGSKQKHNHKQQNKEIAEQDHQHVTTQSQSQMQVQQQVQIEQPQLQQTQLTQETVQAAPVVQQKQQISAPQLAPVYQIIPTQNQSSSSSSSWFTLAAATTQLTRLKDNILGHQASVFDDLQNGRMGIIDVHAQHRIDWAIEEYITKEDHKGLINFFVVCKQNNIALNPLIIERAYKFLDGVRQSTFLGMKLLNENLNQLKNATAAFDLDEDSE